MDERTKSKKKLESYMKLIPIRMKEQNNIRIEYDKYKNNKKKRDELKNSFYKKKKEIE